MICTEGRPSKGRVPVLTHALDIPARLKEISRDFFVMLNTETQKFEVHDAGQPYGTLACVLPFDALDARAIEYVKQFYHANVTDLAREIDEYNERYDLSQKAALIDKANYKACEALKYLNNTTKTDSIPKEVIEE